MGNINSNQKGKVGEREARDLFKKHGFENARRSQQYSGAGFNSFDIVGMPKLGIEVKRVEGLNIFNAMNQAIEDSKDFDVIPTVIHRKNHKKWKVSFLKKDYKEHFKQFEKKNKAACHESGNEFDWLCQCRTLGGAAALWGGILASVNMALESYGDFHGGSDIPIYVGDDTIGGLFGALQYDEPTAR